eukprot:GHRR01026643.1.p1 GENE.GHRR01026643.1~~GHRR01026643.1.p1  ORF type:complete len:131 (+),score=26.22 GHRR01026643.1:909-1301(+)
MLHGIKIQEHDACKWVGQRQSACVQAASHVTANIIAVVDHNLDSQAVQHNTPHKQHPPNTCVLTWLSLKMFFFLSMIFSPPWGVMMPMSPVWKNPSASITSAVLSGCTAEQLIELVHYLSVICLGQAHEC